MTDNEGEANESATDIPIDGTEADTETNAESTENEEIGSGADLTERIEELSTEELTDEIETLTERAETAEQQAAEHSEEIDDLESQLKRKQADFQNYKKRTKRQQEERNARATEDLVGRLLDVRDNLARALSQDEEADIRPGIESTLEEFDRVLADEDVETIEPEPGSDVEPERHEVMMRIESDQPPDTVAEVYRPGYEMSGRVLRPAQITVSE